MIVHWKARTEGTTYIPHHPAVMPSKASTKVKIVYDAAVKSAKDVKRVLYRGPIT